MLRILRWNNNSGSSSTIYIWVKLFRIDIMPKFVKNNLLYFTNSKLARSKKRYVVHNFDYESRNMLIKRGLAPQRAPMGCPKSRQILNIDILGNWRPPKGGTWGLGGLVLFLIAYSYSSPKLGSRYPFTFHAATFKIGVF